MRKVQKILSGIFFCGVLLGGIGTGVALVEYSSLAYGGEKRIGEENLVTRELDYVFVPGEERISIVRGYWYDSIEADETVPEGTIRYVVTYNEKTVEPTLYSWEASPAEREIWEENREENGTEYEAENEAEYREEAVLEQAEESFDFPAEESPQEPGEDDGEEEPGEITEGGGNPEGELAAEATEEVKQTCLEFNVRYISSDFALMMECKDEILAELRQKRIFHYDVAYVTDLKIRVNPRTMSSIRGQDTRYSAYR